MDLKKVLIALFNLSIYFFLFRSSYLCNASIQYLGLTLKPLNLIARNDLNVHISKYKQQTIMWWVFSIFYWFAWKTKFPETMYTWWMRLRNIKIYVKSKKKVLPLGDYMSKCEHSPYFGHSKCGHLVTNASIDKY